MKKYIMLRLGFKIKNFKKKRYEVWNNAWQLADLSPFGVPLYDLDIIFIECSKNLIRGRKEPDWELIKNQIKGFFLNGGIMVLTGNPNIIQNIFSFKVPRVKENLTNQSGFRINPNKKHELAQVFDKIKGKFNWNWILEEELNDNLIIATNTVGSIISYAIKPENYLHTIDNKSDKLKKSRIFVFPHLYDVDGEIFGKFARTIIDIIQYTPDWINKYQTENELKLFKDIEQYKASLKEERKLKNILYGYDKSLSKSISKIFEKMGIKSDWKEEEGEFDIALDLNGVVGIGEVKGLTKLAKAKHFNPKYLNYLRIQEKKGRIKGFFIVNHYREIDPEFRDPPFSRDAIKLAVDYNICLMTTWDLFLLYNKHSEKRVDKNYIIEKILNTKGLIDLKN